MDLKTTFSLVDCLADDWKIDASFIHEILETLHGGIPPNDYDIKRFFNEFSFVLKRDQRMTKAIRFGNLLLPGKIIPDKLKEIKKHRLRSIIEVLDISAKSGGLSFDSGRLYRLMRYVNENPNWILQFGVELYGKGKLRLKIYFGPMDRGKDEAEFMVELVRKIGQILNVRYNKLAIFPVLEKNNDILALDISENGYGFKIYDYCHFPDKKQMDHIVKKYKLINDIGKDPYLNSFCELIEKYAIYGHRNFDTMMTYRFENNSLDLKEAKINVHVMPHMESEKILKKVVNKSDRYIFDYFKKLKLKVSFIGIQPEKFFFYVR